MDDKTVEATVRIKSYLKQRSFSRHYNGDIHGFHIGDERESLLKAEDIETVLSALSSKDSKEWFRLDRAFSNFINGYGDPYEPKESHDAETSRNLKELYDAFNGYRAVYTSPKDAE